MYENNKNNEVLIWANKNVPIFGQPTFDINTNEFNDKAEEEHKKTQKMRKDLIAGNDKLLIMTDKEYNMMLNSQMVDNCRSRIADVEAHHCLVAGNHYKSIPHKSHLEIQAKKEYDHARATELVKKSKADLDPDKMLGELKQYERKQLKEALRAKLEKKIAWHSVRKST